jgi:hypothetical protein
MDEQLLPGRPSFRRMPESRDFDFIVKSIGNDYFDMELTG